MISSELVQIQTNFGASTSGATSNTNDLLKWKLSQSPFDSTIFTHFLWRERLRDCNPKHSNKNKHFFKHRIRKSYLFNFARIFPVPYQSLWDTSIWWSMLNSILRCRLCLPFWPRATLKGPKRSFVVVVLVVVLVLGVETWAKNVTNVTKNVSKHKTWQK